MNTTKFLKIFGTIFSCLGLFLLVAGVDETEELTNSVLNEFLIIKAFGFATTYIGAKALTAAFDREEKDSNN